MVAVITGDVVHSRALQPQQWLSRLKEGLGLFGESPEDWEIFRGDSFQLKTRAEDALLHALTLKAWMKYFKQIDVRMSIGIGAQSFDNNVITEGNGSAFELSGAGFDALGKRNLGISTPDPKLNDTLRVMCDLSLLIMDKWSERTAEAIYLKLTNPQLSQAGIAAILNKKAQGNISETLKRGGFDEIYEFIHYYNQAIKEYVDTAF